MKPWFPFNSLAARVDAIVHAPAAFRRRGVFVSSHKLAPPIGLSGRYAKLRPGGHHRESEMEGAVGLGLPRDGLDSAVPDQPWRPEPGGFPSAAEVLDSAPDGIPAGEVRTLFWQAEELREAGRRWPAPLSPRPGRFVPRAV